MGASDRAIEHAAARVLADAAALDEAVPRILEGICSALGWEVGVLWTVSDDRLGFAQLWRHGDERLAPFEHACRSISFSRGEGLPGRVWASGEPAWIRDVVADLNFPRVSAARGAGLHGAFAFPIVMRGETFGVMEFFSYNVHDPDEDMLATVRSIGVQIGQFARREELQRRIAFQNAILESQNEAALDGILVVGPDARILYSNARFRDIWGIPADVVGDDPEVFRRMMLKMADPDVFTELVGYLTANEEESRRDEIALADGTVLDRWTAPLSGVRGRAWFYRDITDAKRIEKRLRENEQWLAFIAEASLILSQTFDYRTELERLAQLAVPVLGDWCAIHIVEDDGIIQPVAVAHADPGALDILSDYQERYPIDPDADTGVPAVIRTGESVLYEEINEDVLELSARDAEHADFLRHLGFRSAMVVPLVGRDRVLGAISLVSSSPARRYTKDDLRLAEDLAARAAFPIDNARLYEERTRVAQTLQESLLPPELPDIPGTELAARYHPALATADVGGDFYDLFEAGPRTWGVVVGDVSGKGVDAAAVTSLARHTLRAAALTSGRPSEVLQILNTALFEQTEQDRFCTAVYAVVRPRFGRLEATVACAGHPPPFIVRSDGTVEPLECAGTLLGIVPEIELEDVYVELGFGDKLVLYTDGVIEARSNDGRMFGDVDFERLLRESATRGVGAAADVMTKAVIDFQDGEPRDDVALVVVGVKTSIFRRSRPARRRPRLLK
jgi:serine phosphatase RsbU (regulator of sigma subunit)/putative methionine-R-sulfoxide reductase with GAF domain